MQFQTLYVKVLICLPVDPGCLSRNRIIFTLDPGSRDKKCTALKNIIRPVYPVSGFPNPGFKQASDPGSATLFLRHIVLVLISKPPEKDWTP
jgi:hypothetical protein